MSIIYKMEVKTKSIIMNVQKVNHVHQHLQIPEARALVYLHIKLFYTYKYIYT